MCNIQHADFVFIDVCGCGLLARTVSTHFMHVVCREIDGM